MREDLAQIAETLLDYAENGETFQTDKIRLFLLVSIQMQICGKKKWMRFSKTPACTSRKC